MATGLEPEPIEVFIPSARKYRAFAQAFSTWSKAHRACGRRGERLKGRLRLAQGGYVGDEPQIDLDTGEVLARALVGTLDLVERDAAGRMVVVDLKTSARRYTDLQAEASLQLSVYSYATAMNGLGDQEDLRLRFDVLTKTKQPELCRHWTQRDWGDTCGSSTWRRRCCGPLGGSAKTSRSGGGPAWKSWRPIGVYRTTAQETK